MSNFSTYVEDIIYDWIFRATDAPVSPTTIYLGLSTTNPLDDGSGLAEPSGGGYAREAIAFNAPSSVTSVGTSGSNTSNIVFTTATAAWGVIAYGFISDAVSGGNMLVFFPWTASKNIQIGDTFVVAAGDLSALIR